MKQIKTVIYLENPFRNNKVHTDYELSVPGRMSIVSKINPSMPLRALYEAAGIKVRPITHERESESRILSRRVGRHTERVIVNVAPADRSVISYVSDDKETAIRRYNNVVKPELTRTGNTLTGHECYTVEVDSASEDDCYNGTIKRYVD